MGKAALLCAILVCGCLKPSALVCGDGRTCPADTVCDERNAMCLTQSQASVCKDLGIAAGKPCDADGTPGICNSDGYCEPGCGDGQTDTNEQCDDGNFASHDGCSSRCLVEIPTWEQVLPAWNGSTQQVAAYHPGLGQIVLLGGLDVSGVRDQVWQMDPAAWDQPIDPEVPFVEPPSGGWHDVTGAFAPGERPIARYGSAIAYDATRQVLVVFGGADSNGYNDEIWEYAASNTMYDGVRVGTWTKKTAPPEPGARWAASMAYVDSIGKIVLYGGAKADNTAATDTWTYDASGWTKLTTTVVPTAGARAAMAYDASRDKLVLIGTSGTSKTWEFSGGDWTLVAAPGPRGRRNAAMAYDSVRHLIVVFGGSPSTQSVIGDTWEYDGTTWTQITTGASPAGRRGASMVYDADHQWMVLVGGSLLDDSPPFDDLWQYQSNGWSEHTPRFAPPAATRAAVAYSPIDGNLVTVGGRAARFNQPFESWAFDGIRWTQRVSAPVDRLGAGLVYDASRDGFLLTSGSCFSTFYPDCDLNMEDPSFPYSGDTYLLDRKLQTWSKLGPSRANDDRRTTATTVFDEAAGEIVEFGGYRADATGQPPADDTFVFDGTTWTKLTLSVHPFATPAAGAAWDPVRQSILLFDRAGDTWEYKARTWTLVIPHDAMVPLPAPRGMTAMTYNPYRKRMVLAGGEGGNGELLADVWELDTATMTWEQLYVPGTSPLPRQEHFFVMHDRARAPILHGGIAGTTLFLGDTWKLVFQSSTLDEDCDDGMDTDQDAQQDDEDPDCDPPPP